jgi:hypothetical protein
VREGRGLGEPVGECRGGEGEDLGCCRWFGRGVWCVHDAAEDHCRGEWKKIEEFRT